MRSCSLCSLSAACISASCSSTVLVEVIIAAILTVSVGGAVPNADRSGEILAGDRIGEMVVGVLGCGEVVVGDRSGEPAAVDWMRQVVLEDDWLAVATPGYLPKLWKVLFLQEPMENQNVPRQSREGQLEIEFSGESLVINASKSNKPCLFCADEPACWFSKQVNSASVSKENATSSRKLWGLISLSLFFMAVEIVGGVKANSLAVLTDAAHMLVDVAAYAVSLFSIRASGWHPTRSLSYGYFRAEVLGGLVSMLTVWLLCVFLIYEATERFLHNEGKIDGRLMFCTATFGFVINSIMAVWLGHEHGHEHSHHHGHKHEQEHKHGELHSDCHVKEKLEPLTDEKANLISSSLGVQQCEVKQTAQKNMNIQGAYLHILGDLIQSAGLMIGGAIIWAKPGLLIIDLICTLVFSFLVLWTTKRMLRSILGILMEGTPDGVDTAVLEAGLRNVDGVSGIHDLHVSSLSMGKVLLTCHATAEPGYSSKEILRKMKNYCEHKYKISHVTIQIEQDS
ncbi:hypothetical protein H6P81_005969 [Aristolochia fimbriata]|uniref:Uncharacterized protein n=1 Tax=Aristolochia fimbriata TaxID=158543 RepID=A0AAV7EW07_ARIFI|nr:hypothetical protein H6P81_005969 [Aristolochia fimbriata]